MSNLNKFYKHLDSCIVHKDEWGDRDSDSAQANIGNIWRLLKSGHKFELWSDYKNDKGAKELSLEEFFDNSVNNKKTNFIYIYGVSTFAACDVVCSCEKEDCYQCNLEENGEVIFHYFPTPTSLKRANGGDWY